MNLKLSAVCIAAAALVLASPPANAAGPTKGSKDDGDRYVDLAPVGLPVIVNGTVRNYVFVQARLWPAPGADPAKLRAKEPYYRDALVRAAHRTPFTRAGDWTSLDTARVEAVLLAEARRIDGAKSFKSAAVLRQTPRRRTGMPGAR